VVAFCRGRVSKLPDYRVVIITIYKEIGVHVYGDPYVSFLCTFSMLNDFFTACQITSPTRVLNPSR
jgi:hypothetical protein